MISAKITKKGQVTIPKEIRKSLGSDVIEFEFIEDKIMIKPVRSVAGALSRFAKKYVPLEKLREDVWNKVADEKAN